MSTHSSFVKNGMFTKILNSYEEYKREKEAVIYLKENQIQFVTQFINLHDNRLRIDYKLEYIKCPLELLLNKTIIKESIRKLYWVSIQNMLSVLHKHNFIHGDFKSKNIIVRKNNTLVLCDFDLSTINCNSASLFADDWKKATFIFFQLFMVREGDRHHWPYNNDDHEFRNGEQIYNNGPEFNKDLRMLLFNQCHSIPHVLKDYM